ncbi:OmpA family protein [Flavobacterium sp. UMI-01]|uniref:OmpA family protein n=1 Tax=Flavobacterium sp. UMI-01 TaxID=1441053 RepID=UPI001C7DB27C|nr:OmpA family protein [Flavobacterium sp. UMI-01]GIZ09261.1 cell envelope biogenesis protein OmpA [Flavobacterium sp. UMI-01]
MKNYIYITFLLVVFTKCFAQKASVAAADKKYERYAYIDAIATYERIAAKGYKDEKMFQKLGNAYYFNAELGKAEKWYTELFDMNKDQTGEYCYRYAQCLKSIGDYKKADKILELYTKKSGNDQRAKLFANDKNYLEEIKENSGRFAIEDAGINSGFSDYGTTFLGDKLIFASSREVVGASKKVFTWTNQAFTNLYASKVSPEGRLEEPVLFDNKINSKFHESTPVFTSDGKTMYFTRNNFIDGKKGKNSERVTLLKIYKATWEDNEWKNVVELPFNSDDYSVAHPALSVDEKELYFASNMPGTLGQSDLFKVTIKNDGTYSTPVNLGVGINTEGRETFPFISGDNKLYFSSDGRPGLGGLDVYVAKMEGASFGKVENIGAPINGTQDDFGFFMDSKSKIGFFTSNRSGGKGYDDIYKFSEIRCSQVLVGVISDVDTQMPIPNAKVSLFDRNNQIIATTTANASGDYHFDVECGKTYTVRAEKPRYETNEASVVVPNVNGKTNQSIALIKEGCELTVGVDLAKCFGIKMIYFDLDKSNIRKDAVIDLEKILDVMQQHPQIKIDIRSHTDSRQTFKYNESLSDRRAKSTRAWLISKGIDASRLTAKGYGEYQLINKCADGVDCTEEEHQLNRRSEFIVISID